MGKQSASEVGTASYGWRQVARFLHMAVSTHVRCCRYGTSTGMPARKLHDMAQGGGHRSPCVCSPRANEPLELQPHGILSLRTCERTICLLKVGTAQIRFIYFPSRVRLLTAQARYAIEFS